MPPTLAESIKAITDSRPPVTDGITYLTILDMHLNAELLPHLNTILQDPELTQLIGWDLVDSLLSYGEKAEECLMTIAKLGNPREVILKIAEVIDRLDLKDDEEHVDGEEQEFVEGDENKGYGEVDEEGYDADEEISFDEQANRQENADDNEVLADKQGDEQKDEAHGVGASKQGTGNKVTNTRGEQADTDEVGETVEMLMRSKLTDEKELGDDKSETKYTPVDKFCLLVKLLPIVHSRIKTKYPSRFLQTSLDAIFNAYVPSAQATLAVVLFIKVISGHKRPVLPGRKSSLTIQDSTSLADSRSMSESTVPDPEAESEAHDEAKLQNYMLLEFTMMVLRDFVMVYDLEWADRLLEHYHPEQIVKGRLSTSTRYQEDPDLRERDIVVGQLLALTRDLGFVDLDSPIKLNDDDPHGLEVKVGLTAVLVLNACSVFSSVYFGNSIALPELSIFPHHLDMLRLVLGGKSFVPEDVGKLSRAELDATLMLGIWLEQNNRFVAGPLDTIDFDEYVFNLNVIAANYSSPTQVRHAYLLASSVLHAHPDDHVRLDFIVRMFRECPHENLRPLIVGWLKQEIVVAQQRSANNVFSGPEVMTYVYMFLFPIVPKDRSLPEKLDALERDLSFHMSVLNLLYLLIQDSFKHLIPKGMRRLAESTNLEPLKTIQQELIQAVADGGVIVESYDEETVEELRAKLALFGHTIDLVIRPNHSQLDSAADTAEEKEMKEFLLASREYHVLD